jgi:adenylylsulfate kinase
MSFTVWFTGISGSGKTTLAQGLVALLQANGKKVEFLDGDLVRALMGSSLGFDKQSRQNNIRYLGILSTLLNKHGVISVVAAISPYAESRSQNRAIIPNYIEVFCNCSVEVASANDVKGLYARALRGELKQFTGVSDTYEAPTAPEVSIFTYQEHHSASLERVVRHLLAQKLLPEDLRLDASAP